jgi:hypothetical protein
MSSDKDKKIKQLVEQAATANKMVDRAAVTNDELEEHLQIVMIDRDTALVTQIFFPLPDGCNQIQIPIFGVWNILQLQMIFMIGFVKPSSRSSAIDPQPTCFELFSVFFSPSSSYGWSVVLLRTKSCIWKFGSTV